MTATTVDQQIAMTGEPYGQSDGPAAAGAVLPHGTLAFIDATSGGITPDDNSGANLFAGIMARRCDNTGGALGDEQAVFYAHDNRFELPFNTGGANTIAQSNVGDKVYAQDNYGLSKDATTATLVGVLEKYISPTKGLVRTIFAHQDA